MKLTETMIRNLNMYISENHIKQNWIAEMLSMNKMTLNNILNMKKKNITLDELSQIANLLGLSLQELKENIVFKEMNEANGNEIAYYGEINESTKTELIEPILGMIQIIDNLKVANKKY